MKQQNCLLAVWPLSVASEQLLSGTSWGLCLSPWETLALSSSNLAYFWSYECFCSSFTRRWSELLSHLCSLKTWVVTTGLILNTLLHTIPLKAHCKCWNVINFTRSLLWSIYITGCYYQMQSKYFPMCEFKVQKPPTPPSRKENKPASLLMRGNFFHCIIQAWESSTGAGEDLKMQIKRMRARL